GQSPSELVRQGIVAGARSLIWFAAFALLAGIPWTHRWRVVALTAGISAMLLCFTLTGGFFYPSLALPLWVMAALALNAVPEKPSEWAGNRTGLLLPVPVLTVVLWVYFLVLFLPVVASAYYAGKARMAYPAWRKLVEPLWVQQMVQAGPNPRLQARSAES